MSKFNKARVNGGSNYDSLKVTLLSHFRLNVLWSNVWELGCFPRGLVSRTFSSSGGSPPLGWNATSGPNLRRQCVSGCTLKMVQVRVG